MYGENKNKSGSKNFPNPLASAEEKESKKYGLLRMKIFNSIVEVVTLNLIFFMIEEPQLA